MYKNIKWVLRKQIEKNAKTLWTWQDGKEENFTCVYKNYGDNLPLYTPQQLLNKIEEKINGKR